LAHIGGRDYTGGGKGLKGREGVDYFLILIVILIAFESREKEEKDYEQD